MYITECDRCKGAQRARLTYERSLYLVELLQKSPCSAYNLSVCNPYISHTERSLCSKCNCVNVIVSPDQGTHSFFLRLFPLTAKKISGEFTGVANCAAIQAKCGRQIFISTIKGKKSKDFFY
jgi:hypothetical protein